ncbi:Golgi apyrase [Microbotryomycetes sp. JL221]|nr:Golgi apyrase [Microbotryomycetes sp. JL221]
MPRLGSDAHLRSTTTITPWHQNRQFGIVIDAGSSGSRVQIYSWLQHDVAKQTLKQQSLSTDVLTKVEKGVERGDGWHFKVEPGISTFNDNPQAVPTYLKPLLDFARDVIPRQQHSSTPIYLLATAGMRLLPERQQRAILDETCSFIQSTYDFNLSDCDTNIRIISGEEEGLYGWIAVNYLMDGFDKHEQISGTKGSSTYGFLDMGGASTQIAFEPSAEQQIKHADNLTLVKLKLLSGRTVQHPVFVTTWLGFGTNQARDRYIDKTISDFVSQAAPTALPGDDIGSERPVTTIDDPCLPRHLLLSSGDKHPGYMLNGTGDFIQCVKKTGPLLNKQVECLDEPCLFNGVHVPPIDFSVNHFIGISEYWYSTQDVWTSSQSGVYDFVEFEKNAIEYCSRTWSDIQKDHEQGTKWTTNVQMSRLETQCFKAAWIVNILHEGIGIPRIGLDKGGQGDGRNMTDKAIQKGLDKGLVQAPPSFQSLNEVGDVAISWTLGKMVLEVSKGSTAIGQDQIDRDKLSDSRGRWRGHIPSWNSDFRTGIATIKNNVDPVPLMALIVVAVFVWLFCLSSSSTRRRQSLLGNMTGFRSNAKRTTAGGFLPLSQDDGTTNGSNTNDLSSPNRRKGNAFAIRVVAPLRIGALRLSSFVRSFVNNSRRSSSTWDLPTNTSNNNNNNNRSQMMMSTMDPIRPRPLHPSKSAPFLRAITTTNVTVPHTNPNNVSATHWNDAPNVMDRERERGQPSLLPRSHSALSLGPNVSSTTSMMSRTVSPPPMNVIPPSPNSNVVTTTSRPTTPGTSNSTRGGLMKLTPRTTRDTTSSSGGGGVVESMSVPVSINSSPVKAFSSNLNLYNVGGGTTTTTTTTTGGISGRSTPTPHDMTSSWMGGGGTSGQDFDGSASPTTVIPDSSGGIDSAGLDRVGKLLRASSSSRSRTDLVALARRGSPFGGRDDDD